MRYRGGAAIARGRLKRIVELTDEQREEFTRWTRRATTARALAARTDHSGVRRGRRRLGRRRARWRLSYDRRQVATTFRLARNRRLARRAPARRAPQDRSAVSGPRSRCSLTARRRSSSQKIRRSSKRCATSSDSIFLRRSSPRALRDEKAQIQALDRTQPLLPMRSAHPEARTDDYVRHGTTSLFAALDAKSERVIGHSDLRP
jgi:hypothetical protein